MQRRIVITGGGKGIGLATAKRFAKTGEFVALCDLEITENVKEEVTLLAEQKGGGILFFKGDVSNPLNAKAMIEEVYSKFGRIDVLVNCAGILRCKDSHHVSWEEFQEVLRINLGGTWNFIRESLPIMLKQQMGRIINISSELGLIGYPQYAAYCASKGAVIALTKALAKEYAGSGILINSVAPGPVETDLLKYSSLEYNDAAMEAIPLKRFGHPDEIAASIEFLAGEGGSFFVGQIISPNGGAAI